ncbi:uncharacterized protein J7T54_007947 [Emericellopsis cladophorae]|uniref:cyclin-dependent kinase n=1 Tax=Emericellopsis cladophorae TaxID=2686198 RepID=A0A9P9Y842_9HYPO|nr:uncharacterized protein J7T54_007947 [Emericellopsis cladophorae]KAI6784853.1 hypothetical protein J7T54_007947 [Emericellopsis cladophorae]
MSDWKSTLSASERYETIQRIQAQKGIPMNEALPLEVAAYNESTSKDQYLSACLVPTAACPASPPFTPNEPPQTGSGTNGITIGRYDDCRPIAEGVTSEVYCTPRNTALKVITFHTPPHDPQREAVILEALKGRPSIIQLEATFRDQEQRFVLEFPYLPFTLGHLLEKGPLDDGQRNRIFKDVLFGLREIHSNGIIHRDIKSSAILLASPSGPAYISDFGTAWSPDHRSKDEPPDGKILDVGTGPYRAPEILFGNTAYSTAIDMWSLGVVISEAITNPPRPIFESRPAHEDGNQLGLILSIFKTLGTPTADTWPEAKDFKVTPFEMWTVFPGTRWHDILPDVAEEWTEVVAALVRYDRKRATADRVGF